jgi:hypothetical protein
MFHSINVANRFSAPNADNVRRFPIGEFRAGLRPGDLKRAGNEDPLELRVSFDLYITY